MSYLAFFLLLCAITCVLAALPLWVSLLAVCVTIAIAAARFLYVVYFVGGTSTFATINPPASANAISTALTPAESPVSKF